MRHALIYQIDMQGNISSQCNFLYIFRSFIKYINALSSITHASSNISLSMDKQKIQKNVIVEKKKRITRGMVKEFRNVHIL